MELTKDEVRTVQIVFEELCRMKYPELNRFLGSETIKEMQELNRKIRFAEYCKRHGIAYEEMTKDDIYDAMLEMEEMDGYAV